MRRAGEVVCGTIDDSLPSLVRPKNVLQTYVTYEVSTPVSAVEPSHKLLTSRSRRPAFWPQYEPISIVNLAYIWHTAKETQQLEVG